MNIDAKILNKILANQIQQHTDPVGRIVALQAAPDLRPDQVGSIAGHDDHGDLGLRQGGRGNFGHDQRASLEWVETEEV